MFLDQLTSSGAVMAALFMMLMGASVALLAWAVSRAVVTVPREDREFKDAPPIGFRLAWWPIQWGSHYLDAALSQKTQMQLLTKLRKAGLDYSISPAQLVSARVVCAVVMAAVLCAALASFDTPSNRLFPQGFSARAYLQAVAVGLVFGWGYPALWLRDRMALRRREMLKAFPFYLDIVTLCIEAGLNLQGAMNQAVAKGPKGVLRDEFQRVLRDIRAGKARVDSLRAMSERLNEPPVTNFIVAVIQAESMGMNLGPVLRAQADQRRTERFLRAEKLAMEAPVKMLFPLIAFIFPCTFIVLFFPIVIKFLESGF
ncbi:type II secretion system F family protein [Caldimonas brevitalea]|uniref:Secretion system protein n=1 Tax=Caldimonas brevitalea TaxID=413882 RepID=A0A0G3BQF8_9BURK|nr:type II secretion system F family protein [Caldimonas brevitalea]AKJ31664.1 secretion system protein [Caldimonas brevitalea]